MSDIEQGGKITCEFVLDKFPDRGTHSNKIYVEGETIWVLKENVVSYEPPPQKPWCIGDFCHLNGRICGVIKGLWGSVAWISVNDKNIPFTVPVSHLSRHPY